MAPRGRLLSLTTLLFGLAAVDELVSGVPGVAAADLEHAFATTHATLTLAIFLGPGVIALVVEPVLFVLADRYPRQWFVHGGLAAMAVGAWLAALADGPITLALALSIVWCGSGSATAIAQAMLVDGSPDTRGRTLARWSLWSLAGDLAAPALLATLSLTGATWRTGFAAVGALVIAWLAALVVRQRPGQPPTGQPPTGQPPATTGQPPATTGQPPATTGQPPATTGQPPHAAAGQTALLGSLREALSDRVLIAWLFGMTLCDLLDEILVVFSSLHMRLDLRAAPLWQNASVAALVVGGAIGLIACDRLLTFRSERWVLVASALGCAASYVVWLTAPTPWLATVLMLPVGACAAPLYPLAAAQAYARKPEASGAVLAAGHLFTPLGLALPFLVGTVADHAGTSVALALLALQPLGLVVLTAATKRTPGSGDAA